MRLVPRASIVPFLLSNSLIDELPKLVVLFKYFEKLLEKFVIVFMKLVSYSSYIEKNWSFKMTWKSNS